MELSQGNNTVANEWCSVVTSLPFADQLPMAAHDGKLALERRLSLEVTGLRHSARRKFSNKVQHATSHTNQKQNKTV